MLIVLVLQFILILVDSCASIKWIKQLWRQKIAVEDESKYNQIEDDPNQPLNNSSAELTEREVSIEKIVNEGP